MSNIKTPKNTESVGTIEALRCYFGPDRDLTTAELKDLSVPERAELADMVCADQGWTRK